MFVNTRPCVSVPVSPGDNTAITSHLWTPRPQNPDRTSLTFAPVPVNRFGRSPITSPWTNVDFGGRGGSLLNDLTRAVIHMDSISIICGFGFFYQQHEFKVYGARGGEGCELELELLIDNPAGERIHKVELLVERGRQLVVKGLRVLPYPSLTPALPYKDQTLG
ncbi:hypothetical protein BDW74DRAFT_88316 [Aspergillus multicolor]|uniref:uncharacterized protein n=1 Tax=Aspergillus multicolor TaxID=41759 RepID=UPI003CCC917C